MPSRRKKDKHLPARVYHKHGAYYYVDLNRKWHFLSRNITEAMIAWTKFTSDTKNIVCMNQLFDRYLREVAKNKAEASYKHNILSINKLRSIFGSMAPNDITPVHIYTYLDLRGATAIRSANMEKALLSHVFSMAIKWGAAKDNPCRNVKSLAENKRDRYIDDQEFLAVSKIASPMIRCAMKLAYLTALRRGDILSIKFSDLTAEGIRVQTNKTGYKMVIEWADDLRKCIDEIKALPRHIRGLYLFCSRTGQAYSPDGFSAIWQRTMSKALEKGIIQERFTFHDIRRKAATDAEKLHGREYARQLLGHETQTMTANYISGEQRVKALK